MKSTAYMAISCVSLVLVAGVWLGYGTLAPFSSGEVIGLQPAASGPTTDLSFVTTASGTPSVIFDRTYSPIVATTTEVSLIPLLDELRPLLTNGTVLALDQELQATVYRALEKVAQSAGYTAGAGVVMDIETGELLALTSYTPSNPLFNQATNGLFIPGSIIKPFVGIAALAEGIVRPEDEILSTGAIELFDTTGTLLTFKDWKPHGYVNLSTALGVSSNVYFYAIGGGYGSQPGLGIDTILSYLLLFKIGDATGLAHLSEANGTLPTPAWKQATYGGDAWRLADTYLAAIGQLGYQVTPLMMTRAIAAIATKGTMVTPTILRTAGASSTAERLPLSAEHFAPIHAGMEYAVKQGTVAGLYREGLSLAAKTGTAEADTEKQHIHSWVVGYFPAHAPRYAFTFMLARGPWGQEVGAVAVTDDVLVWLSRYRPEYLQPL